MAYINPTPVKLVVNKDPDIPLKVEVDFNTTELYAAKKAENLNKMGRAKDKLEEMMEKNKK